MHLLDIETVQTMKKWPHGATSDKYGVHISMMETVAHSFIVVTGKGILISVIDPVDVSCYTYSIHCSIRDSLHFQYYGDFFNIPEPDKNN